VAVTLRVIIASSERHVSTWDARCYPWKAPRDGLSIHTPKGIFAADFLVVSTGFKVDWTATPGIRCGFAPAIPYLGRPLHTAAW